MLVSFLVTLFNPSMAVTNSKTDTKYWLGLCLCRWCGDIGPVNDAHSPVCRQAMAPDSVPISTSLLLQFSSFTVCVYTCVSFYVVQRGDGNHLLSSETSGYMRAYNYIVLLFNWPAVNDRGRQEGVDSLFQPYWTGVTQASRRLVGQRSFWQDDTVGVYPEALFCIIFMRVLNVRAFYLKKTQFLSPRERVLYKDQSIDAV